MREWIKMTDPIEELKDISNELYEALEDSDLQSTANELLGVVDDVEKDFSSLNEELIESKENTAEWQRVSMRRPL